MRHIVFLLLVLSWGLAQEYSGTFVQQDDPSTSIQFEAKADGFVGSLINGGTAEFPLEAFRQEDYLVGLLYGESAGFEDLFFIAQLLQDGTLGLVVAPLDANGDPIESEALEYSFLRQGGVPAVGSTVPNPLAEAQANPLASQTDVFAGDYVGQAFSLSLQTSVSGYSGFISMNAQNYPLEAQAVGTTLTGSFVANGQSFAFEASLSGATLSLLTDGQSYTLSKQEIAANPVVSNPLANQSQSPLASTGGSQVIVQGQFAPLTEDNARAFFEAYIFSLEQIGYKDAALSISWQDFLTFAVENYPYADQETQVMLQNARQTWSSVQANWAAASFQEKQGFVLTVIALIHGEEVVQQNLGQGASSSAGGGSVVCTSATSCMQNLDPEGYQDMVNAQSCWAGAGCESYDSESNTFYEEPDYSYEVPYDDGG